MKNLFAFALSSFITVALFAQTPNVTWGDEFKMKKGSTDLSVIHVDKDGLFVKEGHLALKSYFVIGATTRESATIVKLDKTFNEVYRSDFNKELKGKDYEDIFFLKDKMFLLASSTNKKDKTETLWATELNKADGEQTGEWVELVTWQKDSKRDDIAFTADYNGDSTKMIIVSSLEGAEKNTYDLNQFDINLKKVGKQVTITNEFEKGTFQLEDVIYVNNGNIVMVGREYEYQEGKKKKAKFLDFKNYVVRLYKADGSLLKEISTSVDAKWLISSKVSQIKGKELVLAAFYSNQKKGKETNGMLVQRIDPKDGNIISTSNKELNTSLISTVEDDDADDEESRKERKERERLEKIQSEEEGFSRNYRFRNFIATEDGGLAILAEDYYTYIYTTYTTTTSGPNGMTTTRAVTYQVFQSGNIMMSKIEADGKLSWLHVLPKNQREIVQLGSNVSQGFSVGHSYFANTYSLPYYSGFGSMPIAGKNAVAIFFNDNPKNANVLQLGQKIKMANRFGKSINYYIRLDAATGKYTRQPLFDNNDIPIAMPRLGRFLSNDFYMVGQQLRILSKSKIAVGRVSFK